MRRKIFVTGTASLIGFHFARVRQRVFVNTIEEALGAKADQNLMPLQQSYVSTTWAF